MTPADPTADDFPSTGRYRIERRLGAGGLGVVYEARDLERDAPVALKALHPLDPGTIRRLERDLKDLAALSHRNLVALDRLAEAGGRWFFTMELVRGTPFVDHVRGDDRVAGADTLRESLAPGRAARAEPALAAEVRPVATALDRERLRSCLRQLAEGLSALHGAGRLHRALKPANVLVTLEGRVVLLDYGLAGEIEGGEAGRTGGTHVAGTVAYLAPEQAEGRPASEASDWYAVGVLLHEALTGRLPFPGDSLEALLRKLEREAPDPRTIAPDAPEDLLALCAALLRRDPAARLPGDEVVRRLGGRPAAAAAGARAPGRAGGPVLDVSLIGRGREIAALERAFATVLQGRLPAVAFVHGPSGMGKTALASAFADRLSRHDAALVLRGRCYEREAVPYKAVDGIVDDLVRHLGALPPAEAAALLPRGVHALCRLFPAVRRLEALALVPRADLEVPDPHELRRRGFAALRELLSRLASRQPLVLLIDDVQWGDQDSAALLADLLRPPGPPALLLLACHRSEDAASSLVLRALRPAVATPGAATVDLAVGPLGHAEARELALALIARGASGAAGGDGAAPAPEGRLEAGARLIARESGGNPLFIEELARYLEEELAVNRWTEVTLGRALRARLARLPEASRRLLEVIAVAGRPVEPGVAMRAAELGVLDRTPLNFLRTGRFVATRGQGEAEAVETYHDRIRETVVSTLSEADLAKRHRRLAAELEARGGADAELLAVHLRGAGDTSRASELFAVAAGRAAEALAFDRAASLYRLAFELRPPSAPIPPALRARLGDALANAGRGAEAARTYQEAIPGADAALALELRRRAADQLLRSGRVDEGLEAVRAVLAAAGLTLAESPLRAVISLVAGRLLLRLRGLGFTRRPESEVPPAKLIRADVCAAVAMGLAMVDPIRGSDYLTRYVLHALRAGEPRRVARGLAWHAAFLASGSGGRRRAGIAVLEKAFALARELDDPHALGLSTWARGFIALSQGQWVEARASFEDAERIYRERCAGVAWEIATAHHFALLSLYYLGDIPELARRLPALIAEGRDRGDLYAAASLQCGLIHVTRLAEDDPGRARAETREALAQWSHRGWYYQHYRALVAETQVDLYAGEGRAAHARLAEHEAPLRRSRLFRAQRVRIEVLHLRARAALAAAAAAGEGAASGPRAALLDEARAGARRLEEEGQPWASALGRLVDAGAASLAAGAGSDAAPVIEALEAAEAALDGAGMALFAAAARRRRAQLLGGEAGAALEAEVDAWMAGRGIRHPGRMTDMLAPGFRRPA